MAWVKTFEGKYVNLNRVAYIEKTSETEIIFVLGNNDSPTIKTHIPKDVKISEEDIDKLICMMIQMNGGHSSNFIIDLKVLVEVVLKRER